MRKKGCSQILDRRMRRISFIIGQHIQNMLEGSLPDIIYIQSISDIAVFVAEWGKQNGIRIVMSEHVLYIRRDLGYFSQKKEQLYNIADQLFCVSQYQYRNLLTNGFKPRKITVVGNMINEHALPTDWGKIKKNGRLIFVATHLSDKDLTTLLSTADLLRKDNIKIDIFGLTGAEKLDGKTLLVLSKENNTDKTITFKGTVEHDTLLEQYHHYSLLLSTSISETFGLSIAEAIAHGTPVVCTDSGGIRDFVNEGNGIVVAPKDANGLCCAIHKALNHKYDYAKMSNEILEKFGEQRYRESTQLTTE